jgi:cytochrome b subunit of formate dehydrogenase
MFVILWLAFVQLMHLLFQTKILGFSTFPRSMTTCFQMMLGKFQVDGLLQANMFFGPLMFAVYNIFIVFILLNMFVSIINDSFASVRKNAEKQNDDLNMVQFVKEKFKALTYFCKSENKFNQNFSINSQSVFYKDQLVYLPEKFDELLFSLSEVNYKLFKKTFLLNNF